MVRRLRHRSLPLALLAVLSLLSLGVRAAWIGAPCRQPCRSSAEHLLIFDEDYYVNAARVIAGLHPSAGDRYAGAPLGVDPNSEHPQLAKLVIAGSIELLGDDPVAWRLPSIALGTLAVLGMFALARAAGGERWAALGAAALMASDNLLIVHGRIGTLDIYVLAAMLWGASLYLRGRPIVAGAVLGVGACVKLVAPYALLVLAVFEALRLPGRGPAEATLRRAGGRVSMCAVSAAGVFLGLLAVLDRLAPPYDMTAGKAIAAGPLHHIAHMLDFAASQTSPHGPRGIASYPWEWIADYKPIVYLNIDPAHPGGLRAIHPSAHFLGMVSPPIMLLALPALTFLAMDCTRRGRRSGGSAPDKPPSRDLPALALAWFLGTFAPFVALSLIWRRTSYLYYMVVVMPGIYLAVADLVLVRQQHRRKLIGAWMLAVLVAAVVMYPFTPLP